MNTDIVTDTHIQVEQKTITKTFKYLDEDAYRYIKARLAEGKSYESMEPYFYNSDYRTITLKPVSGSSLSAFVRKVEGTKRVARKFKKRGQSAVSSVIKEAAAHKTEISIGEVHHKVQLPLRVQAVDKNFFAYAKEIDAWDLPDNVKNECALAVSKYFNSKG